MSSGIRSWMRRISSQHAEAMPLLGRADEIVVADVELLPQLVMLGHDAVGQLDREDPFLRRGALDLLAVLVRAGEEPDVVAHPPPVAGDDVGDDVLVHVPDVRVVVDVVDGGGDVELAHRKGDGIVANRVMSYVATCARPKRAVRHRREFAPKHRAVQQ